MDKKEFTELVYKNIATWASTDQGEQANNLIGYCYDILDDSKELSSVSEALAVAKQELIEANERLIRETQESEYHRNLWIESLNGINLYKNLCKAQSEVINLNK